MGSGQTLIPLELKPRAGNIEVVDVSGHIGH